MSPMPRTRQRSPLRQAAPSVGETEGFLHRGEINVDAAEQADLKLSSQLLKMAQLVKTGLQGLQPEN